MLQQQKQDSLSENGECYKGLIGLISYIDEKYAKEKKKLLDLTEVMARTLHEIKTVPNVKIIHNYKNDFSELHEKFVRFYDSNVPLDPGSFNL